MNKHLVAIIKMWAPLAFLITVVCAYIHVAVQQNYRQSANDPQIEMAEDAASAVVGGKGLQSLVLAGTVDIGHSLSPYLVFYNDAGSPAGGNGLLNGKFPSLPRGVFDYTRAAGEERVTWQPDANIRQAIVVVHIGGQNGGFVMAGRSLREVEIREEQLEILTTFAWIAALLGTLILQILGLYWKN